MKKLILTATIAATALCATAGVNSPEPQGYRQRGELMFQDRNYVGCIDQMRHLKAESTAPAETETADYYIALSAAHLNHADARALLGYFLWKYPASALRPIVQLEFGNIELDNGRYGEALTVYESIKADALDEASRQTLDYNMAYCLIKRADYDRADALLSALTASKRYANGARFYRGYIAYVKGDYRRAADLLKGVDTSTAPGNMAEHYLSQIYFLDGDYNKAAATARRLLNSDVDKEYKTEAARIIGESEYNLGNDAEALRYLNQYVAETDTPLPSALYILGVTDYRRGDYTSAIRNLTPVSGLDNAIGQSACLFIGQSYMQKADYSPAMIAFEKAARMDFDRDTKETAYYNYAVARTEGGKIPFVSSVTTFEEFLRKFPDSHYSQAVREYIVTGYMTDNNYPAALASIEAIPNPTAKILKAKQQVLYTLGTRELAAGHAPQAVERLRAARALRSHDAAIGAETDLWLGEALYAAGKYEDAARMFREALANRSLTAANRPLARYDLGYALFQDGKYADALSEFSSFLNNPGTSSSVTVADAYNRVADAHYYSRDYQEASDAYSKAITSSRSTADYPMFQKAIMNGLLKNRQAKIDGLLSMMREFPQSSLVPAAMLELGETYDLMNLPDKTVETYSALAARYPSTSQGRQASLLMAMTYVNNGNFVQAETTYKNLISQAPTSDEARQATDKLRELMADRGRIDQYVAFINGVPGVEPVDSDRIETSAFQAAERDYLANGTVARITDYLERYPEGAHRQDALAYAVRANATSGNYAAVLTYAAELLEKYPDSANAPEVLKAKADAEYAQGKGELALESYTRLSETASTPYMTNEALIGIIRTARDLNLNDRVIGAADPLLNSGTVTDAQRSEATFAKALALSLQGQSDEAEQLWRNLASDPDKIFGAKSAYYLAQAEFDAGLTEKAETDINGLINSDTPHIYWLARGFILLSDINARLGNDFEARQYLISLKENYPGSEVDIFNMIEQRLSTQNQ